MLPTQANLSAVAVVHLPAVPPHADRIDMVYLSRLPADTAATPHDAAIQVPAYIIRPVDRQICQRYAGLESIVQDLSLIHI